MEHVGRYKRQCSTRLDLVFFRVRILVQQDLCECSSVEPKKNFANTWLLLTITKQS